VDYTTAVRIIEPTNNFDLLRLLAATQVALEHSAGYLDSPLYILSWISAIPGVPIFFFISGLLIYGSFTSSLSSDKPLRTFYVKRVLRLYPGLWVCFLFSAMLVWTSGFMLENPPSNIELLAWVGAQNSFFQFYNPEFLRAFGVGALNGVLWTIAVELQFYLLFPLLYRLLHLGWVPVLATFLVFLIANHINIFGNSLETTYEKLIGVSFVPWFYMFLLGAIAAHYQEVRLWVMRRNLFGLVTLLALLYLLSEVLDFPWGNRINFAGFGLVAMICFKLAFLKPGISDTYLKKNDISYGVYIYHMPIINFIIYLYGGGAWQFYISMLLVFACATASWFFIERPSLRRKPFASRRQ